MEALQEIEWRSEISFLPSFFFFSHYNFLEGNICKLTRHPGVKSRHWARERNCPISCVCGHQPFIGRRCRINCHLNTIYGLNNWCVSPSASEQLFISLLISWRANEQSVVVWPSRPKREHGAFIEVYSSLVDNLMGPQQTHGNRDTLSEKKLIPNWDCHATWNMNNSHQKKWTLSFY